MTSQILVGHVPPTPTRRIKAPLIWKLKNFPNYFDGWWRLQLALLVHKVTRMPVLVGSLRIEVRRPDGVIVDYGVVGHKLVTTTGAGFIVDAFQNIVELEIMKYHAFGTGAGAEAAGNTALGTELTTEYATDNTRPTGTQTENGATVYETVGILDPDSAVAITEHALMSQAATGGGVMLDRTLFSVINIPATGGTLTVTYDFTVVAGS